MLITQIRKTTIDKLKGMRDRPIYLLQTARGRCYSRGAFELVDTFEREIAARSLQIVYVESEQEYFEKYREQDIKIRNQSNDL